MTTVIRKDTFSDTSALVHPFTHVLSDESVDAYDDLIRQLGWELRPYQNNPIVLLAHNSQEPPIGTIPRLEVRDKKLLGRIEMAPRGTSERIDELRKLMGLDGGTCILRGVSVGFFPIESRPRAGSTKGGREFLRQRLCEVSVCSVPANSSALAIARSMKISRATMATVFTNGSLVSQHIAQARKAVAQQQHQYSAAIATIERRIEGLWLRIGEAVTEQEQQALIKQLKTAEKAAALITPEHLRTADQRLLLRVSALKAERERNDDPWGIAAAKRESEANYRRAGRKMEQEYMEYLIANPHVQPEIPRPGTKSSPSSGNIVTWRGQRIDITPTWRGKKIY
jgi:hypothetical protein